MKKYVYVFAALALAACSASPAIAQTNDAFTGARVEVTAGAQNVQKARNTDDLTYGAAIGIDAPLGDRFIVGVEADTSNIFDRDRTYGASARLGAVVAPDLLIYGKAGYKNFRAIDFSNRDRALSGLRVGGGFDYNLSRNIYTGLEYRYTDFNQGVGVHGGLAKIGVRF